MSKLTFEELRAMETVNQAANDAADWVREQAFDEIGGQLRYLAGAGRIESPLEAQFSVWWYAMRPMSQIPAMDLRPQHEVVVRDQRYRLDFSIVPEYDRAAKIDAAGLHCPDIAVELDGHDFHERTREQVAWRNQRDRDLQSDGWIVLHYSGSEVYKNPTETVLDCACKADGAIWAVERSLFAAAV